MLKTIAKKNQYLQSQPNRIGNYKITAVINSTVPYRNLCDVTTVQKISRKA